MALSLLTGLRIAQAIFALIVLSLSSYVANWYNKDTLVNPPSQIVFVLFAAVFTHLSILYLELAPRFAPKAAHIYALFAVSAVNTLFYFAGFIALAVFLSQLLFCRGRVCAAARTTAVFSAFEFLLWLAASVLIGREAFRGGLNLKSLATDERAKKAMKDEEAGDRVGEKRTGA